MTVRLWDQRRAIGGMNHFVLPGERQIQGSARQGYVAMQQRVDEFVRHGCWIDDLRAKVFGGADVLPVTTGRSIGAQNVRFALDLLEDNGIPVVARRTGGINGRQIMFHTATGEVLIGAIGRSLQRAPDTARRRRAVSRSD